MVDFNASELLKLSTMRIVPAPSDFGNEDGTPKKVIRFKVSDLYEPLDTFRSLGLPTIDWQVKEGRHEWSSNSEEGTPETD